jgi:hypothetical protein
MSDRFVVAEVSKNWLRDRPITLPSKLIAQSFEEIINHWDDQGYKLHSFTLHRLLTGSDEMNETIIAVFEKVP